MYLPNHTPPEIDYSVRPVFRVLGAVIAFGIAVLFIQQGLQLLPLDTNPQPFCFEAPVKSRMLCELGAWMLSFLPEGLHAPVLGLAHFAFSGFLLSIGWLLLKPIFIKERKARDS